MDLFWQHLIVAVLVIASLSVVIGGLVRTFVGKASRLGKCCSKGCGDSAPAKPAADRVVFFPSDSLRVRR